MIGVFAYYVHRWPAAPGSSSWASIRLIAAEAGAAALILLLAVITAGRSQPGVTLAWLRLAAVVLVVILMSVGIGFTLTVGASDDFMFVLSGADALADALICAAMASSPQRGHWKHHPQ